MPGPKNADGTLAWLRRRNRQRVMEILRMHGQITQADIARATGLSRTTVSTLVSELKEAGLVADIDTKSAHAHGGRPGVQLVLRNPSHVVVGIDFGHSHVAIAVADLAHNVLAERWYDLDVNREAARALDVAADLFAEVLSEVSAERTSVLGVGMGIPGPVDRAHGTAGSATILPGWVGLRIAAEMEQRLEIPVQIENDETLTLARIVELASGGDLRCRRALADAGREIGVAVAGLCNLINPERVIVGGLMSQSGEVLLAPLRESIRRHAVQAAAETVDVRAAVFVVRAELLGSVALALLGSDGGDPAQNRVAALSQAESRP